MKIMIRAVLTTLWLTSLPALADMPSMKRVRSVTVQHFGDVTVQHIFDSRKDPMGPEFVLKMFRNKRLLMELHEVAFDSIHASPRNDLFVGLSNGGWPGSAVIIFDRRGQILLLADHQTSTFDYCMSSSTMLREWYDDVHPEVVFPALAYAPGRKPGITLRDCHGNIVDLLDTVHRANVAGMAKLRETMTMHH